MWMLFVQTSLTYQESQQLDLLAYVQSLKVLSHAKFWIKSSIYLNWCRSSGTIWQDRWLWVAHACYQMKCCRTGRSISVSNLTPQMDEWGPRVVSNQKKIVKTFSIKNNTWCFTNFWAGTWFPPTGKDREMAKQTVLLVRSSLGLLPLDIEILRKCKQETFDPIW